MHLLLFSHSFVSDFLGPRALQHRRRQWQLTPVLLPGKSHGWRSLVGCSPWGRKESDTTERLSSSSTAARQASLSLTIYWRLLKLMSTELVMPSNHFILCCPFLFLPSIFPSSRVFSSELVLCIRWPKYWSFNISPSREYSGLISFTIDWLDLLAVQGTCENFLQHHSSKASILCQSDFLMVQLSHLYMILEKTIA